MSTTEAKYVIVTEAIKEMIWLQGMLSKLGFYEEKYALYSDDQSAIHLAKNLAYMHELSVLMFITTSS